MGIHDRHYHQSPPRGVSITPPRMPSRFDGCPVVKWLMISNIVVYFLNIMLDYRLWEWGHFSVGLGIQEKELWRLLTFQFLHADGYHLFANMLGLFFFGHFAERWWGSRKFTAFYLGGGTAGALLYMVLYYAGWFGMEPIRLGEMEVPAANIPLVGASAGIFAILVCVAVIAPRLKVFLFFIIPMSMRGFAIGALVFSVYIILSNGNNAGGEAGHLGGAILGFVLMKFPGLLGFVDQAVGSRQGRRVVDARVVRKSKMRPRVEIDLSETEVDRILDKVNREGIQSLSEAEKETLRRAAGQ